MTERRRVALFSLLFTYLFFLEYLPPLSRVHLPFDIESYHYPLLNYAFQSLSQGRLPEWDAGIYCGLSFVGNVQAALFYPPNWLLFAVNAGRSQLLYKSFEMLVMAHLWLAFFLCYIWLRGRSCGALASTLGAGVFAYSGYSVSQIQHVGVVAAYAWLPLGLRGIDQAVEQRDWRPLWKLVMASALWFLAGYPPAWVALGVCAITYAASSGGGWKAAAGAGGALAASLAVSMIQVLPALQAVALRVPEIAYGGGLRKYERYLSYFLPNYFNLGREGAGVTDPTVEYLYLGAPALLALAWAARQRLRGQFPALVIAGVSLIFIEDPFGAVGAVLMKLPVAPAVFREWNFFAGLTLAAALLTAGGLDEFLQTRSRRLVALSPLVLMGLLAVWSARQIIIWSPGGARFGAGSRAAFEPLVMLTLLTLGLHLLRFEKGRRRIALSAALLISIGIEYKVFGTNKRFNAHRLGTDEFHRNAASPGFGDIVRRFRASPEFRVAVDETAVYPTDLRHVGLATPQGFDPLLPEQYKKTIETSMAFATDRTFELDPSREELLQTLGVRYFWTRRGGVPQAALMRNPSFRPLTVAENYFQAFEFLRARPAYRWDGESEVITWTAGRRAFRVRSPAGGRFVLVEQFYPGWRASVDGRPVTTSRWGGAFQAVEIPAGEHGVEFVFRSAGLRWGAGITVATLLGLWLAVRPKPKSGTPPPPGP